MGDELLNRAVAALVREWGVSPTEARGAILRLRWQEARLGPRDRPRTRLDPGDRPGAGRMIRRLSAALDHSLPILGGVASLIHCLFDDDRLARWLRTNPDHEPEGIG